MRDLLQLDHLFGLCLDAEFLIVGPHGGFVAVVEVLSDELSLVGHSQRFVFVLGVLLFLVPPPFVHLRLRKTSQLGHLCDFLLVPVGLRIELHLQGLDLIGAFSLSFLDPILILFILIFFILIRLLLRLHLPTILDPQIFLTLIKDLIIFNAMFGDGLDFGEQLIEEILIGGGRGLHHLQSRHLARAG